MRNQILFITVTSLTACTARPVGLDDEAGVTTAMDESSSESSESSESEGSSTESTSEDSLTFVPDNDFTPVSECDPFAQDCPPGHKCVPYATDDSGTWDGNKCVPVMGDQQPGEPCWYGGMSEATDDCDATSMCWFVTEIDGALIGECLALCQGSADAPECPPGTTCPISGQGSVTVCIPTCDPLAQDCDEGQGCFWNNSDFQCIFTAGEIPAGEPCGYINDCAAGHICIDAASLPNCAGSACCTAYCDRLLGDAGCVAQPNTVCTTFFEEGMAPPGEENLGICTLAP